MSDYLNSPGAIIQFDNPAYLRDPLTNLNGTHFSHAGVGGFVEVPMISDLYAIPTFDAEMNPDGFTSGRRKLGMIVYVIGENKYYQLRPTAITATSNEDYLNQWNAATKIQRLVWMNPVLVDVYDEELSNQTGGFELLSGTGDPADAWVPVLVGVEAGSSGATGGGGLIPSGFNVIQTSIGSYSDGMFISGGTLVTDVIKRMLQKQVPPVYLSPIVSATWGSTAGLYEIGAPISAFTIVPTFTQRDGGALIGYTYFKDGADNGGSNMAGFAAKASTTFSVTAQYAQGPIKNDSLGEPYPAGRIEAGTTSASFTTTSIYPWYYFKTSNASFTIDDMKAAIQNGTAVKVTANSNGTIIVPFNVSAQHIGVAYPAASQTKTNYWSSNSDLGGIESVFLPVQTSSISSPAGYWNNISYKFHITDSRKTNPNPNLELRN